MEPSRDLPFKYLVQGSQTETAYINICKYS